MTSRWFVVCLPRWRAEISRALLACYADDVEIHKAEELPFRRDWRRLVRRRRWLLPRECPLLEVPGVPIEIPLNAQIWSDGAGTVCALFRHRAVDPVGGARFDAPEVGIYQVCDQRVVRSQMFHADSQRWSGSSTMWGMIARANGRRCHDQ